MSQRRIRPLRVLVSLAFFSLTAVVFLDVQYRLPADLVGGILYLQLVPSLIRFLEAPAWAAAGFFLVLGATLLFGRVYCSSVCPLGTLQDIVSRIADRRRRKSKAARFRYARPRNGLRWGLLAATLASAAGGSLALVVLLDPFSLFGRAMTVLARPAAAAGNNLVSMGLEAQGIYALPPVEWTWAAPWVVATAVALLLVPLVLAARHGRLFCNTLCPVGALLGLVSRLAVFRIRIDRDRCTTCAQCSLSCKAECIDLKHKRVDFSRCVACFDCIPVCSESGIRYGLAWTGAKGTDRSETRPTVGAAPPDRRRRLLLGGALAWLAGLAGLAAPGGSSRASAPSRGREDLPQNRLPTTVPVVKTQAVAPPGAGAVERFNRTCTACTLCIGACPTRVIQPALLAYGPAGLLQPHLDYSVGYCTYECVRCGEVCPTGAIAALEPEAKKRVRLGKVRFVEDNCVVVTDRTDCGACAEHCPTRAVYMVPYREDASLGLPELDDAVCVGCGACEHVCPVRPHKAIYVDGEAVQGTADPPRRRPEDSAPLPVPAPAGAGAESAFPF